MKNNGKGLYKIVNRTRFSITLSIFSLFFIILLLSFKVNAKSIKETNLIPVYVNAGDTLWSISRQYAPENIDLRLYIDKVIKLNELETVVIMPGQLLYVPDLI